LHSDSNMLQPPFASARATLARRRCSGCRRTTAFQVWPWQGRLFVTTHGLCRSCVQRMTREVGRRFPRFDAQERYVVSDLLN